MLLDQATRLRELARERNSRHAAPNSALPLVAVSGGRGGVGASTIAYQLAASLTSAGQRALFVEADLDRGGRDGADSELTLMDCLQSGRPLCDVVCQSLDGPALVPGLWAPSEQAICTATAQERLIGELRQLSHSFDVAIIDLGSGRNAFVKRFWSAAVVLVVTAPDASAIRESYAAIKLLHAGDTSLPVYTLVNFANETNQAMEVHDRLRETCRRFLGLRTTPLGVLPAFETSESEWLQGVAAIAASLSIELGLTRNANALQAA